MSKYTLSINGFQGIADRVDITLNGFVSIQGETSCGKSSIRRALNALLFNSWESSYLNKNCGKAIISLSKDNWQIIYERTAKSVKYKTIIDGLESVFDKPGQSVPDEIQKLTGIKELDCEKESYNIHISKQQTVEPLFMIANNEAQNTRVLNRVFNVTKFEIAGQLCLKDIRETKNNIQNIEKLNNEMSDEIKEKDIEISKIQDILSSLKELNSKINLISDFVDSQKRALEIKEKLTPLKNKLTIIKNCQIYFKKLNLLDTFFDMYVRKQELSINFKNTKEMWNNSNKAFEIIQKLKMLAKISKRHLALENEKQLLKSVKEKLASIKNVSDISNKLNTIFSLIDLYVRLDKMNLKLKTTNEKISKVEASIKEIGVCPTCGGAI